MTDTRYDTENVEQDPTLDALTSLSEAAASSAKDLNVLDEELAAMRRHRRQGWSWRRIVASNGEASTVSAAASIAANLARAAGRFRRGLARALHNEGMQINEIATLFAVSRQRVSALTRARRT
jgi:hypothetical protein